ncbi:MAG: glycosyltransferase family 39 protein [Phycisphaerae bacterium]
MTDAATLIILASAIAAWWTACPGGISVGRRAAIVAVVLAAMLAVRLVGGASQAFNVICVGMVVLVGLLAGYWLTIRREWPQGMVVLALASVTAGGTFWRQDVMEQAWAKPLQPDVRHFQQQAQRTFNPYAAGLKSPLWSAMHAPLLRLAANPDHAMRFWSWIFGVAMLPIVGLVIGRLFDPVVGVVVAGSLAADPYLASLCCEGLREEMGLCLWMAVLFLLFDGSGRSWKRVILAGATGGVLIWLRNVEVVPLTALLAWVAISRRWTLLQAAAGLFLSLLVVLPFYVNQYRTFGNALAMEQRETRGLVNLEFLGQSVPADVPMPTAEQVAKDPFAGEPVPPAKYLLGMRTPSDLVSRQLRGLYHVLAGRSFEYGYSRWTALACAAGLVATVLSGRHRFVIVLVLFSLLGIRAHMVSLGHVDLRLLLPVMVMWLTAGTWFVALLVRLGGQRWLAMKNDG